MKGSGSTRDLTATEARIRQVLRSKNVGAADYWRSGGKERFARELAEDGLPPDEAAALLNAIDRELFPPVTSTQCFEVSQLASSCERDPSKPPSYQMMKMKMRLTIRQKAPITTTIHPTRFHASSRAGLVAGPRNQRWSSGLVVGPHLLTSTRSR